MITGSRAVFAALLALCDLGVAAAEITTSFDRPSTDVREVSLVARRVDGAADPVTFVVSAPGRSHIALPQGLWEIRVASDALWAASVHVRNTDAASMRLLPAFPLTGTSNELAKLTARFTPLGADGPSGEVDCAVTAGEWSCGLPHGRYDIQFFTPGMAPEFRYAVSVPPRASEPAIALRFVAGASLHGWVEESRSSKASVEGVEVWLDGSGTRQTAHADRKGFFQFKAVPPGDYVLSARTKGLVAQPRSVRILRGVAAEVREPLVLDTPKRLTVLLVPPLNPDGVAWRVQLSASDPDSNEVSDERASAIGMWSRSGLVAGTYRIAILDDRGGMWKSETVTIGTDDVTLPVTASGMMVRGRVMLGDRPLPAKLSFGGEWGRMLQSDDEGRFAGEIPLVEGEQQVVFVEADTPNVRRSVRAKIEPSETGESEVFLNLPATTLMGTVSNEDGSPARAIITVSGRGASEIFEQASSESDGTFQIAGLAPGAYDVVAEAHERKSRRSSVNLKANEPAEVKIVLEPEEMLRGKMTMGEMPVIDATIFVLPRDAWAPTAPQTKTNERGNFQLRLPPGTTIFDGIAVHPAFDTVIARATVRPDRIAWIPTNQIGGTIVVESQQPDDVVLLHRDAEVMARTLANLGGGMITQDRVTLTRLEPGEYSVCSRDRKRCASGYLAPHGTLNVALK